jgi:hypothetical protein
MIPPRHRLAVCTDLTSIEAGVREPDDAQSLIRLLLYTCDVDLEGILVGSNLEHGHICRPELAHTLLDAYASDHQQLLRHDARYPKADSLRKTVHGGWPIAGRKEAVEASIGAHCDSDASRYLIERIDNKDPRPLHIALWGGGADIAQALWRVAAERNPHEAALFRSKIRIHAIGDQDSTCAWMKTTFPDLAYITRSWAFRGMYRGGDTTLCDSHWVRTHIHGHGALGTAFPDYQGGDIWSSSLGRVTGIKEGDTPSVLPYVVPTLNPLADPTWTTWGGRCVSTDPQRWSCAADFAEAADPKPEMASVHRWRPAFQRDFSNRLDRLISAPGQIPTAPTVTLGETLIRDVHPGERITLAAESPSALSYAWWIDQGPSAWTAELHSEGNSAELTAPHHSGDCHVVVTARGTESLEGYARCILRCKNTD